ncbi:RidA family protein [Streptomyces sp. NPDC047315]|uniref:RidA family protein n=1 Tax=Streptomyces sp. NPDC047315 TaxID=3155142 RepID=UPI0033F28FA8
MNDTTGTPPATTAPPSRLTYVPNPRGVAPGTGYTNVVMGTGRLVAISGQIANDENGDIVGEGDPAAQARQVFENLRRCLAHVGAGFDDVIKLTYFVTDIAHLPAVRAARDAYVNPDRLPASSAVQVAALFRPELLLEIEAFAVLPDESAGPAEVVR